MKTNAHSGFTIVELLIVIVVIGILATISLVAYNGVQARSHTAKINSDLVTLEKAIRAARNETGQILRDITGSYATAGPCTMLESNTDLSVNNATTASCWSAYNTALNAISNASGTNIRGLKDPWGRPYFIDENEKEFGQACNGRDVIAAYLNPHVYDSWSSMTNRRQIPYITPGC
jgi:prepilin-type N-terminal cleavage/methylation domain-containing protein